MFRIIVQYGIDQYPLTTDRSLTVADVRRNHEARAHLGYGDNIKVKINGVEMADGIPIPNGSTVTIETAANSKA